LRLSFNSEKKFKQLLSICSTTRSRRTIAAAIDSVFGSSSNNLKETVVITGKKVITPDFQRDGVITLSVNGQLTGICPEVNSS
jgi:hypothetical protein